MIWALPGLVSLTLLVCGTIAVIPSLWQDRAPQAHPRPATASLVQPVWVVRSGSGRWFIDGEPVSPNALSRRLRQATGGEVHLLVSAQLSSAEAAQSLRWLRTLAPRPVLLDLPARSP